MDGKVKARVTADASNIRTGDTAFCLCTKMVDFLANVIVIAAFRG